MHRFFFTGLLQKRGGLHINESIISDLMLFTPYEASHRFREVFSGGVFHISIQYR